ncbi:N-acetyltransferase [Kaistella daneshvariae]|uniref:N-acetyltransferase n=1 Tax=Kaistella daneshvariae TaxID=2487074 RepID=A0ABN5SWS0_9FLAO|nr:GNAT family N-acetyltransferase [Kaistella daneshvariae]AZI66638.1 N-acetyltransferase [Kaistella daneshvariae]
MEAKQLFKILIRPLTIEDAAISYRWRNDPSLWKYTVNKPREIATRESEENWLKIKLADPTEKRYAIVADDCYIGNVHFTNMVDKSFVIHIFIGDKRYHKKGISTLAIYQLCYCGVHVFKCEVGVFRVSPENQAVLGIIRSFGLNEFEEKDGWIAIQFPVQFFPNPSCTVGVFCEDNLDLSSVLENILKQKCDFTYDIMVGGDLSDGNMQILSNYAAMFPGKFFPFKSDSILKTPSDIESKALGDHFLWYRHNLFEDVYGLFDSRQEVL